MTSPFQSIIDKLPNSALKNSIVQDNKSYSGSEPTSFLNSNGQSFSDYGFRRPPLCGGTYGEDDALRLLNAYYFVGKNEGETAIFRINDDGSATFVPSEQFKLEIQNICVITTSSDGSTRKLTAEKFWKEHPARHQRTMVFKPAATVQPYEFNRWRGFGVEPRRGWHKQRRLLRHIHEVICRGDPKKFKYLIKYLAWCVQHPDKHAGVIIVLKSRKQGTGKTTLGNVMLDILGEHGARIDDKERLLGRFNDWLETTCFVLLEEATWAGDHKATDKLKSLITGDTILIERKFGTCRQVPNRLKAIATTNHDHAVSAGVQDRRNVVFDVSDKHAGDKAWFDKLHQDLANGGTNEFLDFLQGLKLGQWHPRQIIRTAETIEQQRMSSDSVSQWAQACIEADEIVGMPPTQHGLQLTLDFGTAHSTKTLHDAYRGYCKQSGLRPMSQEAFGKACTEMFGPRKRLKALASNGVGNSKRRPWGYHVPKGKKWQEEVDARLGIKK